MTGVFGKLQAAVSSAARLRQAIAQADAGQVAEAFPVLARAAQKGDAEAQFRVGRAYLEGAGVPPSRIMAAQWLECAAATGKVEAQMMLATLYLTGGGPTEAGTSALFGGTDAGQPDYAKAAQWARLAAAQGSGEALALLGYVATSGPEEMRDLAAADAAYARSAELGCPQGSLGHGMAILRTATDDAQRADGGPAHLQGSGGEPATGPLPARGDGRVRHRGCRQHHRGGGHVSPLRRAWRAVRHGPLGPRAARGPRCPA